MLSSFSKCSQRIMAIAESIAYDLGHINVGSEHLLLALAKDNQSVLKKVLENKNISFNDIKNMILKVNPRKNIKPIYMEYSAHLKSIIDNAIEEGKKNNEDKIELDRLTKSLLENEDSFAVQIIMNLSGDLDQIKEDIESETIYNPLENIEDLVNLNIKVNKENNVLIGRDKELKEIEEILLRKSKRNVILIGEPGVGKTALVEELARRINKKQVLKELENKVIYQLTIADIVAGSKYRGEFEDKLKKIIKKAKGNKNIILFIDEIHSVVGAGGAEGAIDASNILKPYLSSGEINCIGATTFDEYYKSIEKEKAFQRRFQTVRILEPSKEETLDILKGIKEEYEKFHHVTIMDDVLLDIVEYTSAFILDKRFPDKAIDLLDLLCVKTKYSNNKIVDENIFKETINLINKHHSLKDNKGDVFRSLTKEIKGQDKNITLILETILNAKKKDDKPLVSFLFKGPSGVGKTKTAALLAKYLYNDNSFLKLNMEEYEDAISISKLLGAMPGYVGYEDTNAFKPLVKNPNMLVLIDNFDKASKNIKDCLVKILEEGFLIDNCQRKIDFRNAIVIFTLQEDNKKETFGFLKNKSVENENELDQKVDSIIRFDPIEDEKIIKDIIESILLKNNYQIDKETIFSKLEKDKVIVNGVREIEKTIQMYAKV